MFVPFLSLCSYNFPIFLRFSCYTLIIISHIEADSCGGVWLASYRTAVQQRTSINDTPNMNLPQAAHRYFTEVPTSVCKVYITKKSRLNSDMPLSVISVRKVLGVAFNTSILLSCYVLFLSAFVTRILRNLWSHTLSKTIASSQLPG